MRFFTLSRRKPVDDSGLWEIDKPKLFAPKLRAGQRLEFTLRANPVRRVMQHADEVVTRRMAVRAASAGGHRNSTDQKHDIVMLEWRRLDRLGEVAPSAPELVQQQGALWLAQQGERAGFAAERVLADGYQQMHIGRGAKRSASITTIDFSGVLRVVDPARMVEQLWAGNALTSAGLGSARAFGCGLMLVRRPAPSWGDADDDDEEQG